MQFHVFFPHFSPLSVVSVSIHSRLFISIFFSARISFFDLMMLPSTLETVVGFCFAFCHSFGTFTTHYCWQTLNMKLQLRFLFRFLFVYFLFSIQWKEITSERAEIASKKERISRVNVYSIYSIQKNRSWLHFPWKCKVKRNVINAIGSF